MCLWDLPLWFAKADTKTVFVCAGPTGKFIHISAIGYVGHYDQLSNTLDHSSILIILLLLCIGHKGSCNFLIDVDEMTTFS